MKKSNLMMIATLMLFIFASCGEDETAPVPVAEFSYEVDSENPLMVSFTNTSQDAETYSWDFGDGNT
ncbi:MAG TPA: transcriptional regulator, partial [Cytophagales bacterium]|nr:transcriptional regulator [Cytophagales bacterium]